jgi:uncharacterized protein YndB with AHSA1/START domain
MNEPGATKPLRRSVTVACEPDMAFRVFTIGIASWWPLRTHSMREEHATSCAFEARPGGRIYEVVDDGTQEEWGRVLTWEPPNRVVYAWKPNRSPLPLTEVEVRLEADGPSRTRVELLHRGWERLGAVAAEARAEYGGEHGWPWVLGLYASTAGAEMAG